MPATGSRKLIEIRAEDREEFYPLDQRWVASALLRGRGDEFEPAQLRLMKFVGRKSAPAGRGGLRHGISQLVPNLLC